MKANGLRGSTVDRGMPKGSEGAGLGRPKGAGAGVAAEVSVGLKHCLEIGKFISGLVIGILDMATFCFKSAKILMIGIKGTYSFCRHNLN